MNGLTASTILPGEEPGPRWRSGLNTRGCVRVTDYIHTKTEAILVPSQYKTGAVIAPYNGGAGE